MLKLWLNSVLLVLLASSAQAQEVHSPGSGEVPGPCIAIIGGRVITGFDIRSDGSARAVVRDDVVVVVRDGRVEKFVDAESFKLTRGDTRVRATNRWVVASPSLVLREADQEDQWMRSSSLLAALVHGIGWIGLPSETSSSVVRCAMHRIMTGDIQGAMPFSLSADPSQRMSPGLELDIPLPDRLKGSPSFSASLKEVVAEHRKEGRSDSAMFRAFIRSRGEGGSDSGQGMIRPGVTARLLVVNENPLEDVGVIFDPHAMVVGNKVMRRAEIEVLRDLIGRSTSQIIETRTLLPEGAKAETVDRWTMSTGGEVFGGLAAGRDDQQRTAFLVRRGQPRFDRYSGRYGSVDGEGPLLEIDYRGLPERFSCIFRSMAGGLSVNLSVDGREPVRVDSPGESGPPLVELPVDLLLRSTSIADGIDRMAAQEFIFGNGPIAMAPRTLRLSKVATDACPPCFENLGTVYRLEMFDQDVVPPVVMQTVIFAMDDGVPVRIRVDDPIAPTWYEHLEAESSID